MHRIMRVALLVFVCLSAALSGISQVATGAYTYGTFDKKGIDTINLGNLNTSLTIPVINIPGRGMPFEYSLLYNSSVWTNSVVGGSHVWTPAPLFGWSSDAQTSTGTVTFSTTAATYNETGAPSGTFPKCTVDTYSNFVYLDPLGSAHAFNGQTQQIVRDDGSNCPVSPIPAFTDTAIDGSGYSISVLIKKSTITAPNGKVLAPWTLGSTGLVQDANGNQITNNGSGTFTDTTGHTVLTVAGTSPSPHTFTYKDTSGTSRTATMTYVSQSVQTHFGCSGVGEYGPTTVSLVDSVTLPDGSAYHFTYEATPGVTGKVTGRIASVQLPQGGTIQYSYSGGNNGITCADGSTSGLTRTVAADSGSDASTWSYTRTSTGTNDSHTEVVDGLGNYIAYDFVEPSGLATGSPVAIYYETHRNVYQGPETGTPVLARATCYNVTSTSCTTTAISLPVSSVDVTETLDGVATHGSVTSFNGYGAVTQKVTSDFGTPPLTGGVLSNELWTYGGTIPVNPTEYDVKDASGNFAGKTTYVYDSPVATVSSGVPQHVAPSIPPGNLTKITQYASLSVSNISTATYEDTGSIITLATPNGTITPSWNATFSYMTNVAFPTPSSGIALSVGGGYDQTYTNLPTSSIDPNANNSTLKYDKLLRLNELDAPDGGKTTWTITPTQTSTNTLQATGVSTDTETESDGYGRASRVAIANGQSSNGWYQQDTCYDGNGNAKFMSYQYQSTGLSASKVCSGNGDTYTYDVLGRVKSISRAGAESLSYSYKGRATQSTDENGLIRISQINGLGNTTSVCELSTNAFMPGSGSPTACGTDLAITSTGFITTYAYDLANHKTTVSQGVQSRVFQTDWLGRQILVQEPESGLTTYSYAYNATGLVVTRKKPKANQLNSTVLTTTTTQFDSLDRPTAITYDDGTPTKTFAYDKNAGYSGFTQANLKGQLSLASVSGVAFTGYSYDSVGRTASLYECLSSVCTNSTYYKKLSYTYDLTGNLKTSTDGSAVISTYGSSIANETKSLTSSLSNSTNPTNLISSVTNGPHGFVNGLLGNGLSTNYIYDQLNRIQGGWVCAGSVSQNCGGGSSQTYGFFINWQGSRVLNSSDTVLNQQTQYGYDEFNRLTSQTVGVGPVQNISWSYDRWGNRLTESSGLSISVNTSTNQINSSGYTYDAAGNMTQNGTGVLAHAYTYDAEGNITQVDGGSTAQYIYNALNQRVRTTSGAASTDFLFNADGQRVSTWDATSPTHAQTRGQYYWGLKPVAYYIPNGATHFQHQNWLGTERIRTAYNGAVEGSYASLPFGNGQTSSGSDGDQYHYAMLDYDSETGMDHAQFRQHSSAQGRWMQPDPYAGSYDPGNPQSFNRYSYVLNNPLSLTDWLGLDGCENTGSTIYDEDGNVISISDSTTCTVTPDDPGPLDLLPTSSESFIQALTPPTPPALCDQTMRGAQSLDYSQQIYKKPPMTTQQHIEARHMSGLPGVSNYYANDFWRVKNMNAVTFLFGTQRIEGGSRVFDYTFPNIAASINLQNYIGKDKTGKATLTNHLVVKDDCSTVITSYPIP